jgi:hypothetical protein
MSLVVHGCAKVKFLTRNETRKVGLTVWFLFNAPPDPGDKIAMVHFGEHGVAAAYTRGVVEGIATKKMASTSAIIANRLQFNIFLFAASRSQS